MRHLKQLGAGTTVPATRSDFHITVPGKWILVGEHAVLRGCEALVFPLNSKYLSLDYIHSKNDFKLRVTGENASDLEMIIWSVFEKALNEVKVKRSDLHGELSIHSSISFGAGMGASATLSVGIAQFFHYLGFLKKDELFIFAKKIEDLFHGESSGVDVAVALYQKPLIYKRGEKIEFIDRTRLPLLALSYTGTRGVTKDCVNKVKNIFETHPEKAKAIDMEMAEAVQVLKKAMNSSGLTQDIEHSQNSDLDLWLRGLELGQSCFEDWGLVPYEAQKHITDLKTLGALGCKMTGSGGGGYVLSLWSSKPTPAKLAEQQKKLFQELIWIE